MTTKAIPSEPRLLPPGCDLGATDEPVEADRWKNMVFDKDGRSHIANPIYPTEAAAKQDAEYGMRHIREVDPLTPRVHHDGTRVTAGDISHATQIPWLG
jgi:hypothetical protein